MIAPIGGAPVMTPSVGPIPSAMPPPGPLSAMPPPGPLAANPLPMPPPGPLGAPLGGPVGGPLGGPFGGALGGPGAPSPPPSAPAVKPASSMIACPRCGTQTPVGFAYCQQCGLNMQALQPTDPGSSARPRTPSSTPAPGTSPSALPFGGMVDRPIDAHGATLAADHRPPPARPSTAGGLTWGTAILVNRDGSDGQRFPLVGEYTVVGRAGADIAFDDDRFLARQHARFERAADGSVKLHSLDTLNGVFRKADLPVELVDGMILLVGREVLRFERVLPEEMKVTPLVRHGVALFGSPPREPWGRLHQIVPSGSYRDVRHLMGEEVVLGREEGDIVYRDDAFMSRRHAALTWDGRKAMVTDLGSSNGTFVRITGPTPVKHGDHVRMGDQLLRIELGK
ncbi:MAG: FHA domain-containing protein [Kofleriaceae bacterium]|nr:FHA domain-containing protein [Kofleriaceae bacterium]